MTGPASQSDGPSWPCLPGPPGAADDQAQRVNGPGQPQGSQLAQSGNAPAVGSEGLPELPGPVSGDSDGSQPGLSPDSRKAPSGSPSVAAGSVAWLTDDDVERLGLRYPNLSPEDISYGRALVATWPTLTDGQWRKVAAVLGVRVAEDGSKPVRAPFTARANENGNEQFPED